MTQSFRRKLRPVKVSLDTFNGWSDKGYSIIKGSKAVSRDANGAPLFSNDQVRPKKKRYYVPNDREDWDWDNLLDGLSE